ncbi:tRNA pseudouridine(38-40) synthase TruA [Aestuariirhabdus sp. Z084]|uniref:tRNA pseudouridine(38-40) synthase TruA n=1 Tax=Aestuariirhabdus haliotis TaxID=2918751 RepID=UPI00201B3919|nr:tRNA pseudouridine(38-40) synthase TruA [Aestuariirhabdus haliotis]MCL6414541.1 tRNA pseudouridine(38-40) synthase TruA [Aestuariirhabdus haliotis]MCL6418477.1 tRNA pseudouridine(38-40) synthase TruA [Aestuariirhabdus haliotis]
MINEVNEGAGSVDSALRRYAASVQYDGADYHGWQAQRSGIASVQRHVESAFGSVANHEVSVVCAGRTDSGVHASHQVIHFDSPAKRTPRGWAFGANANLPDDIAINWVQEVDPDFHARFSAVYRRYRYVILNQPTRSAILPRGVTWNYRPLDVDKMEEASRCLLGEHDFSSYRAVGCQAKSPVRTITDLKVQRFGSLIVIDVQANAFLHHMIRNIAGVLMAIGSGKEPVSWAQEVLDHKDRARGGVTAPPYGLYFVDVGYPEQFSLPRPGILGPMFLGPLLA